MLESLLEAYGYSNRRAARESGVSATSIARFVDGARPSLGSAVRLADLFNTDDAADLLEHWGYDPAASRVRTSNPDVANGWRLDTLIAEQRKTNALLQQLIPQPEPDWYKRIGET